MKKIITKAKKNLKSSNLKDAEIYRRMKILLITNRITNKKDFRKIIHMMSHISRVNHTRSYRFYSICCVMIHMDVL